MAPKQTTLGSFLKQSHGGAKPAGRQQSKLSFAKTKDGRANEAASRDESSGLESPPTDTKKRARTRLAAEPDTSHNNVIELSDDDDDKPVLKRARRLVHRVNPAKVEEPTTVTSPTSTPTPPTDLEEEKTEEVESRVKRSGTSPTKRADQEAEIETESDSDLDVDAEVDDKPREKAEVVAKAREKLKARLVEPARDPYPDWAAGAAVPYAALCTTFSLIELTTKRLQMTEHCALFLRQVLRLTPDDLLPTVLLMINKLAPDYAGIELGIGESLIMKAIGETTGRSLQVIKQDQKDVGDLGLVAVKSKSTQKTMFKPQPLTIRDVHKGLMHIATVSGNGAQGWKVDGIKKLLAAADSGRDGKVDISKDKGGPSEAKFIVRFLEGKLRLGLAEKTVLVSLAQAMVCHEAQGRGKIPSAAEIEQGEALIKAVYSELPSYEIIIQAMLEHGVLNLRSHCNLRPGVPLKPMLAKPTKAITEVLDRFEGQTFTCEYKYDGERAQIHYVAKSSATKTGDIELAVAATRSADDGIAAIFSRNSEDLSRKYPDVLARLPAWIRTGAGKKAGEEGGEETEAVQSFVLDCETVAWDVAEKKVLPFQQLMTRKKKDVTIAQVKVRVCIFAFDLLYLNGAALVGRPLRERRALLQRNFAPVEGEFAFATHMDSQELDGIQVFLDQSVKASCEGLMVKMLDGTESGYEPSKRSRNWLKIKKDYLAGVGDSLDLIVVGGYHGKGKRTSVYGAFLLACYDPRTETMETVCNIGTGFSEQALEALHAQLADLVIDRAKPFYAHSAAGQQQPDVWFEPQLVWEVRAADLTISSRYRAAGREGLFVAAAGGAGDKGVSLRFPRFIRLRDDKKPADATTSRQIAEMYLRQESVAKSKGPAVDDDFEY